MPGVWVFLISIESSDLSTARVASGKKTGFFLLNFICKVYQTLLTTTSFCAYIHRQEHIMEQAHQPIPPASDVGFPPPPTRENKKSSYKWVVAVLGVIIILGGGGFVVLKMFGGDSASSTPTPEPQQLSSFTTPEPTSTPNPTVTPSPEPVDKSEYSVEILNGTGVAGEASFLKAELEDLGFEDISAANAESQDETRTTVTYDLELPQSISDELTERLNKLYSEVRVKKASLDDVDISIVTGPRKESSKTSDDE